MMNEYKVYCLKLKDGTIVYVGLTRQEMWRRLHRHKSNKNFPHHDYFCEIIQTFDRPEPAYELEKMLIQQYDLIQNGWNSRNGNTVIPEQKPNKGRSGQKSSPEHVAKIAEKKKQRVICLDTGIVYESGKQAAEKLGLKRSKISNVCHGKRKSTGGLRFKFID